MGTFRADLELCPCGGPLALWTTVHAVVGSHISVMKARRLCQFPQYKHPRQAAGPPSPRGSSENTRTNLTQNNC